TSEAPMVNKPKLMEHDEMVCRNSGNEERASEGYPCADCGTFICLICSFRGVTRCKACEEKAKAAKQANAPARSARTMRLHPSRLNGNTPPSARSSLWRPDHWRLRRSSTSQERMLYGTMNIPHQRVGRYPACANRRRS